MSAKQMSANYKSRCGKCGGVINPGTQIMYERGAGSWHVTCPQMEKASKPKPAGEATITVQQDWRRRGKPDIDSEIGKTLRVRGGDHDSKAVMVLTQKRRFQSDKDNEDMGDMCGGGWFVTLGCRLATPEEEAPLLAQEAEARAVKEAAAAIKAERGALNDLFLATGERPEKAGRLQGEEIPIDTRSRIYGGGSWFVIEPEGEGRRIWYVINNGHDGDDWSYNNVETGGAGAIGRPLPWSAELDARCRAVREREE